jgi:ATP-dependent RNA helicase DeaD
MQNNPCKPTESKSVKSQGASRPSAPVPTSFHELGLSRHMSTAAGLLGYEHPTPIQAHATPVIAAGRNVMAQAQGGSGKTAAFGFPALDMVRIEKKSVQVLILVPTRVLAEQHFDVFTEWAATAHPGLRVMKLAGEDLPRDRHDLLRAKLQEAASTIRDSRTRPHVVIATMGRLLTFLDGSRKAPVLQLGGLEMLVIDEVDQMLSKNPEFAQEMRGLVSNHIPAATQVVAMSATWDETTRHICRRIMEGSSRALVEIRDLPENPRNVAHFYETVECLPSRKWEDEWAAKLRKVVTLAEDFSTGRLMVSDR